MEVQISTIYYVFLLLAFVYFAKYHFLLMNSISAPTPAPAPNDPNDQAGEIPEDEFYHHPVWPERWYKSEFTDEGRKNWMKEPWYKSAERREAHRFITRNASPCCYPWGFIIYRTVYTPESDLLWPLAMEKLTHTLNSSIEGDLRCGGKRNADDQCPNDSRPEQLTQASRKDAVISDASRWNGASVEQIREHFAEYLRKTDQFRWRNEQRLALCLVIDERALKSILVPGNKAGWVGAVDGRFDPAIKYGEPSYRGFMRVKIRSLWEMYLNLDFDHMHELCPGVPKGWIPVYSSGDRVGQDESGEKEVDFSQIRPPLQPGLGRGRGLMY